MGKGGGEGVGESEGWGWGPVAQYSHLEPSLQCCVASNGLGRLEESGRAKLVLAQQGFIPAYVHVACGACRMHACMHVALA